MKVDLKASDSIYDALASDDLTDDERQAYIKFLVDFYVSKNHLKLESVGYISG
jgi:hypothetical protein